MKTFQKIAFLAAIACFPLFLIMVGWKNYLDEGYWPILYPATLTLMLFLIGLSITGKISGGIKASIPFAVLITILLIYSVSSLPKIKIVIPTSLATVIVIFYLFRLRYS